MYIENLIIQRLRSIENAEIEFNTLGKSAANYPNINVILGENGAGKTTVLRAIALAALGPLLSSSAGYVSEGMVRVTKGKKGKKPVLAKDAFVTAKIRTTLNLRVALGRSTTKRASDEQNLKMHTRIRALGTAERLEWQVQPKLHAESLEKLLFSDRNPEFFIVAYGATRRVEASARVDENARIKSRLRRYERVANLFEEHVALMPLSFWLPELERTHRSRYLQIYKLINELLPKNCQMQKTSTETQNGIEHLFEMNGVPLPFRMLSDGFRAYIGWVGDMLFHACRGIESRTNLRDLTGVVLIDEIDLHLHPEWQRTVLPTLGAALPNVQFIVTTHSALVVGSLQAENLFMLIEENEGTVVKRLPERVHGRSADQILLSPYFGLDSTRAVDTSKRLNSLARAAVHGNRQAATQYLKLLEADLTSEERDDSSQPMQSVPGRVPKTTARKVTTKRKVRA
jgi:predicted ATP-dependent endonuclease of OLD family